MHIVSSEEHGSDVRGRTAEITRMVCDAATLVADETGFAIERSEFGVTRSTTFGCSGVERNEEVEALVVVVTDFAIELS